MILPISFCAQGCLTATLPSVNVNYVYMRLRTYVLFLSISALLSLGDAMHCLFTANERVELHSVNNLQSGVD